MTFFRWVTDWGNHFLSHDTQPDLGKLESAGRWTNPFKETAVASRRFVSITSAPPPPSGKVVQQLLVQDPNMGSVNTVRQFYLDTSEDTVCPVCTF